MNEDIRAQKDALENLNTRKSTSRRILTGILSKNFELKAWEINKDLDKTQVKLFPNFTCHHLITHTNLRKLA